MKPGFAGPMLLAVLLFVAGSAMGQSVPATEKTGGGQPLKRCTDLSGKFTEPCPVETKTEASKSSSRRFDFERTFPRSFVRNQVTFWTSPVRMRASDLNWALPLGGLTAILIASDTRIEDQLPKSQSTIDRGNSVANYGVLAAGGLVGGAYLFGKMRGNSHLSETGWMSGEAVATTLATTFVVKAVARRARPLDAQGNGFGQGGSSFPSEHSAAAWSIASVFAHEYPGFGTKVLAYGAASAMSASRVIGRKHFSSDVLIGSALGWWLGRQVFESHNLPAEERAKWGSFKRSKESEDKVSILGVGSPYVPLDSWVYPAFDRLAALGYVQTAFLGLRPWTRMECARLVEEARTLAAENSASPQEVLKSIQDLELEFRMEIVPSSEQHKLNIGLDSVYTRFTGIQGSSLRDSYHFGQTLNNDFGRPYAEGFNMVAGLKAQATAGPLAFFIQAEYQHAPAEPQLSSTVQNLIAVADVRPFLAQTVTGKDEVRILDGYVALNAKNFQISFGKQSLWMSTTRTGSLLLSNNATPVLMLRVSRVTPFKLPGPFKLMGPIRTESFLGRLTGHQFIFSDPRYYGPILRSQPYIHGEKISFKPTPNLEFGLGVTGLFGGDGMAANLGSFRRSVFGTGNADPGYANDPGDRRSGFDFSYRIPGLRNWLVLYNDSLAEDEFSPLGYPRRSAMSPGIYLPKMPGIPKLDLRLEAAYTNLPGLRNAAYFYFNNRYHSGYTNDGLLLGNTVGRQGVSLEGRTTYWISSQKSIQGSYRNIQVDKAFLGGGRIQDAAVRTEFTIGTSMSITTFIQYENWSFPVLAARSKSNLVSSVQILYNLRNRQRSFW